MASRSWNRVELIGNLTRDPELRFTPTGSAVCTFGLATNRTYVSDGERKEEVDFHRLVSWNKLAELCNQLLKKGNKVFISGRLQTRQWEGQDGVQRNVTEIVVEDMILLSPKPISSDAGGGSVEGLNIDELPKVRPEIKTEQKDEEEVSIAPADAVKEDKEEKPSSAKVSESEKEEQPVTEKASNAPQEDVKEDEDLPF